MSIAAGARSIMAWALRGTKQLSPYSSKYIKMAKGSKTSMGHIKVKGKAKLRPWIKKVAGGDKSWLGSMGIGAEGRTKFVTGYAKSYRHLKKHKKLYAAGGAGAAAWDFLPGKDNT